MTPHAQRLSDRTRKPLDATYHMRRVAPIPGSPLARLRRTILARHRQRQAASTRLNTRKAPHDH